MHNILSGRIIKINSILVAIIIAANLVTISLSILTGLDKNLIIIPFIFCLLISILLNKGKNAIIIILLSVFFLLFFFFSYLQVGVNIYLIEYFQSFLIFGVISFFVVAQPFDHEKVLHYTMVIYGFLSLVLLEMDIQNMPAGNKLGFGYLILPAILGSMYGLFKPKLKPFIKLFYLFIFIWYGYFMVLAGTRGAYFSIVLYVFILLYLKSNLNYKKFITLLVLISISVVVYLNMMEILLNLKEILYSLNIDSNFIDKSIIKIQNDNVDNGRYELYEIAFYSFSKSWMYGNGIGFFQYLNDIYVHNVFLEMLDEGGILLTIPVTICVIYGTFLMFLSKKIDKGHKLFLCFVFCLAIPKVMVSSIYWKEQSFWIFLMVTILLSSGRRLTTEK
ncbi:O-antigen ligase family protein [Paenibacillus agricola]|uniref:O-antigen ligase-related domain-containing protein n=1 Tax=Paenibacillus agricola TaxID=2716264 RepID=A0ABX0JEK6_9BACL|nr:O-antigen ligase family protein [Paenibacillus agricola]NHN34328.1 hypothetical protein [Paenibacillus agricola]